MKRLVSSYSNKTMEFGGFSAGPGTAQRGASEGCVAESLSQAVQCQTAPSN